MIFVLAGRYDIARSWSRKRRLQPKEWKYLTTVNGLQPMPGDTVIFTCDYYTNALYSEINKRLKALNVSPTYESCCDEKIG